MVPTQVQDSASLSAAPRALDTLCVLSGTEKTGMDPLLPSSHSDSQPGVPKVPNAVLWAGVEMRGREAKPCTPREAPATDGSVCSPLLVGMGK